MLDNTTFRCRIVSNYFMAQPKNENRLLPLEVATGFDIARFLNERSDENAIALKVFELCQQLDQLRRGRIDASDDPNENAQQTVAILAKLNAALDDFRFVPHVGGLDQYFVLWRAAGPRSAPTEAGPIVKLILQMTEDGTIGRVRKCLCDGWFLAQTNKKVVCSDACRFRKFKQANEEFNENRAEYMRGYRNARKKRAAAKRKGHHGKRK